MSAPRGTGIGLDFGTSNSTAAWFDGRELHYVRVESDGPILPTAIHLDQHYTALTGRAAIEQYVEENRGRLVELAVEIIGEASGSIGGADLADDNPSLSTSRNPIYGQLTDRGLKGRLFHGLKRLLGDPTIERLSVFGQSFRIVALITPILERIRAGIEGERAERLSKVHIGRPVNFEGRDADRNAIALSRLGEAAGYAGLTGATFYPEPIAATLSWLWAAKPAERRSRAHRRLRRRYARSLPGALRRQSLRRARHRRHRPRWKSNRPAHLRDAALSRARQG